MKYQTIFAFFLSEIVLATIIPNDVINAIPKAENVAIQNKPNFAKVVARYTPNDRCQESNSAFIESMTATLYSEPDYKGYTRTIAVNGAFGCFNELPNWKIRSFLSTGSTSITMHYGKDCLGHVIDTVQGGRPSVPESNEQPGSIFVKFNRYGSC